MYHFEAWISEYDKNSVVWEIYVSYGYSKEFWNICEPNINIDTYFKTRACDKIVQKYRETKKKLLRFKYFLAEKIWAAGRGANPVILRPIFPPVFISNNA